MATKTRSIPSAVVRRGKVTFTLTADVREQFAVHEGDKLDITSEKGRLVLTPAVEPLSADEEEAIRQAEAEFARGGTHRLTDVLHGVGGKA